MIDHVKLRSSLYNSDPEPFSQYHWHLPRAIKSQRKEVSKNLLSGHYLSDIILDNKKCRL